MHIRQKFPVVRLWVGFVAFMVGCSLRAATPDANAPLPEVLFPQLNAIMVKALTQSNTMLLRNIDIAQAEASEIIVKSQLLPRLDTSVYYSSNTTSFVSTSSVSSRSSGLFYSLSASQPVYQWGTLKAQADSAKIGTKIAEKNYAEAYRMLALSLRSQYTGLILKKMGLRNAEFGLKLASAALDVEEERLRNGRISAGDIIAPRLSVDDARLARDKTEADLNQSIRYFCRLAGLDGLEVAAIPDTIDLGGQYYGTPYTTTLVQKFTGSDVEDTIQAQIYRDNIAQADLSYKVAKYRLYPKFSASAGISQYNSTSASVGAVSQVQLNAETFSITAAWNIFDGFATIGAKRSALAFKESYQRQLDNYLRTASEQARDLERALNFSSRAMQLADTRRALQQSAVQLVGQDLARGVGTQNAVDGATNTFYQSELAAVAARADFLNKWAEFLSALNLDPALQNLPARYLSHGK